MSEPLSSTPPHRATILVGYGDFGLNVLRRLLASAAPRGVLTWEEPAGGGAPADRHLEDLALLWVPERPGSQIDIENAREGNALEMMRDLYRQIQPIGEGDPPDTFARAVEQAADLLLSASARTNRGNALPLGLDVIVIAQPASREVIGALDRLLVRGMERLANKSNLERAVQGSEALNFIGIFDFDHYWDRSEKGQSVRRAIHTSIEFWQKRREQSKPAFGRYYLVDGHTEDGRRESVHRADEISLFLELLLFEGQRDGELRRIYQPLGQVESAVATFGIRLMERSAGLLSHLAAAHFGIGWLDYMAGTGPLRSTTEPVELQARLKPYTPEKLDELVEGAEVRREVEEIVSAMEQELIKLPVDQPDWPRRVREHYSATMERVESTLLKRSRERMTRIVEKNLSPLAADLHAGVAADLHNSKAVQIAQVIDELTVSFNRLQPPAETATPPPGEPEDVLRGIETLHSNFVRFHFERLQVDGLRKWWSLLAVVLAAGLTPIVVDLLGDIPKPDKLAFSLNRAYEALQWIKNPFVVGVILFLAVWLLGAAALQPRIARRIERARNFFNDTERGRFVGLLRGGLRKGGALRVPIDARVDRVLRDMSLSIRGEVAREVGRVLGRLKQRRDEILWLREQLRGFLRMHGGTGEDLRPDLGKSDRDATGIRYSVERSEDFERIQKSNLPTPDRFGSIQAEKMPFKGWDERYGRTFLVPLAFLDDLSRIYPDPFQQEMSQPGVGPQQQRLRTELLEFLAKRGSVNPAFRIPAQQGLTAPKRYCLLPPSWRGLSGVLPKLADLRIPEESVFPGPDSGRAYVLSLQTGVEPKCIAQEKEP